MKTKILPLIATLLIFSNIAHGEKADNPRWQYKVWVQPRNKNVEKHAELIETELNRLGEQGWVLVSVTWKKYSDNSLPAGRMVYFFKRQVKSDPKK